MSEIEDLREIAGCTCDPSKRRSSSARVVCKACGSSAVVAAGGAEFAQDTVTVDGPLARPPSFAIAHAEHAAAQSPCRKSKRGASIYRVLNVLEDGREVAQETHVQGYNGPPWVYQGDEPDYELACDGSEACRKSCGDRCLHAEARAIMELVPFLAEAPSALRMVHVKIDPETGRVVAGNGPSCVPCSKTILDRGIHGIWLYECVGSPRVAPDGRLAYQGAWRYYRALEFHEISMAFAGVHHIRRGTRRA